MCRRSLKVLHAFARAEPTPTYKLESWTRFTLIAPHYIDMTFRCRATQHVFHHKYIGLFWASYINAPEDKSMYFRGHKHWQQLCTPQHNNQFTGATSST